jgi:hypothetical protein
MRGAGVRSFAVLFAASINMDSGLVAVDGCVALTFRIQRCERTSYLAHMVNNFVRSVVPWTEKSEPFSSAVGAS